MASLGNVEVFATIYTTDDVDLSTDRTLNSEELAHVIEVLNSSNHTEDSIKDTIESAIDKIPEAQTQDGGWVSNNFMFRSLNAHEVEQFKQWARENFTAGGIISELWHPVAQAECAKINAEAQGIKPTN